MTSNAKYSQLSAVENAALTKSTTSSNNAMFLEVLYDLNRDAQLLIISKAVRLFSFGFLSVMLVIYLEQLGYDLSDIGILFTYTLLGDAVISILLTSSADRVGRKVFLQLSAFLTFITSLIFVTNTNFTVITMAAIFGVISPSGNEIGPFMSIELSSLSEVTSELDRTMLLAWYNLFGSFASAIGALLCGSLMALVQMKYHWSLLEACKGVLVLYAVLQLLLFAIFSALSNHIEVPEAKLVKKEVNPVSLFLGLHKSKSIVLKLSSLFMIDSFAGSFILQSIVSSWFHSTYNTSTQTLGTLVFVCNLFAGISALFAAQLANSIGLILTMVVTHLPSNVLVILVPLMPTELTAIIMLCARYSISQMDVPTRNAYVQSVVDSDERSAANGVTNVVRSIGGSMGPLLAGWLYAKPSFRNYPFFIAGGLKIIYDILLLVSFSSVKPKSEQLSQSYGSTATVEDKLELVEVNTSTTTPSSVKV